MPSASKDRGRVEVKKPARMRWTFTTGDKNEVVADGVRMYSYFPRDRYVVVSAIPADEEVSTALLFLAGRGDLTRDFTPSLPPSQPAGEWHLTLMPKTKQPDFTSLTIQVNRQTLALTGLIVVDTQGGTQKFRFENLRENRGLVDASFTFLIPRGVEIRQ
jgi:outer membrane lipoprotein carrier protein